MCELVENARGYPVPFSEPRVLTFVIPSQNLDSVGVLRYDIPIGAIKVVIYLLRMGEEGTGVDI